MDSNCTLPLTKSVSHQIKLKWHIIGDYRIICKTAQYAGGHGHVLLCLKVIEEWNTVVDYSIHSVFLLAPL